MRNKIQGMFLGTAIGDALGMPVETWGRDRILNQYPEGITKYETPDGHKWFEGEESGTVTDDTQLTMAVIRGIISGNGFNLSTIAKAHVDAMTETTAGWGNTTRESIRRLANGVDYKESAVRSGEDGKTRGVGNGVPMKLSPLAAWYISPHGDKVDFLQKVVDFSAMTHYTKKSAYFSVFHTQILINCLLNIPQAYDPERYFFEEVEYIFDIVNSEYEVDHLDDFKDEEDDVETILQSLQCVESLSFQEIAEQYKGTCYVYDSMPYTYAHWLKNHATVDVMYDSINWGGERNDGDSNASMLGAMLGALHGVEIFEKEKHLITGLKVYDEIMELSNDFCDCFDIQ